MLLLLYEEGPHTRGIFRRSANAKTCKELKEKLLCGDDVQMGGESVFVAAAVITVHNDILNITKIFLILKSEMLSFK